MIKFDTLNGIFKELIKILFLKITKEIENYFEFKMKINIIKYVKTLEKCLEEILQNSLILAKKAFTSVT